MNESTLSQAHQFAIQLRPVWNEQPTAEYIARWNAYKDTARALIEQIGHIEVAPVGKKFQTTAVLKDGQRIVLKKSGAAKPQVQFYAQDINGNATGGTLAAHCAFSKSVDSHYVHIATIPTVEAA